MKLSRSAWLLALLLSACHRESAQKREPASAASPSAAPAPSPPALIPLELDATLRVPALAAGSKASLLVLLHGLGSSGQDIEQSDWGRFASEHGVALLAPSGPRDSQGRRYWNADPTCCDFERHGLDHVAALRGLIEHALAVAPLDRSRVFVGGHSNGGFMAHRLACEAPDLVRAIVSIAGVGPLEPPTCKPIQNLRVLQVHGDADRIVPYPGGHLFSDPRLPQSASALGTVRDWAQRLGCNPTPRDESSLNFDEMLPGAETRVAAFSDCARGRVELWTVHGGGHSLGFTTPAPELIWNFLNGSP